MFIHGSHLRILGNGNVPKFGKYDLNFFKVPLFWGGGGGGKHMNGQK